MLWVGNFTFPWSDAVCVNFLDCHNVLFQGDRTAQMWNIEPISIGVFSNFVTLQYVSGFHHALLLLKFLSCMS